MRSNFASRPHRAVLAAATAVMAIASADVALAQADTSAQATEEEPGSQIVVIGTRRTDRTVTDSASPVDVISAEEISTQPAANMLDVVKNLVPSFFVPQNTISDASTFVRAPSLRGLAADNILVMMNGKRFNRSALVQVYTGGDTALSFGSQGADISSIPAIGVGNLQILRDGATAQYGSDAIGGVLNYGLRKDKGIELQALYGQHFDGDPGGHKTRFGDNGRTWQVSGYAGMELGDTGYVSIAGEYSDSKGTSRGVQRPTADHFASQPGNSSLVSQLPNYPGPVQIWGSSPSKGYKVVLNAGFDVGEDAEIYLFGNLANSEADQSFNHREAYTSVITRFNGTSTTTVNRGTNAAFSHPIYLTPCPTTGVTGCPTGGWVQSNLAGTQQTYNFTTLYPAGFTPRFVGETDQVYGTVGFRGGDASKIKYDLSVSLARNQLDLSMYDSLSPSFGPATQTSFEFGKLIQKELTANLDLSHDFEAGFASPLTFSFGAEFRRETYETTEGDLQSYAAGPYAVQNLYVETAPGTYAFSQTVTMPPAASGYGGTSPTFAGSNSQKSWAVYGGLEGDVSEKLSMGLATRYEHYDSFGDAVVWKANALYEVADGLSLRGTIGTGFHAPSPGQNNTQILTTTFVAGDQVQVGTYPVTSPIAQYFGATSLRPERSNNYGLGMVIKPANSLTLTVDWYSIKVKNRIGISQNFAVTAADIAVEPDLAAVGVGGVVNYFTNGFSTVTRGVDVVGTYKTDLAGGRLNLTLAYNYNKSKVTQFDPTVIDFLRRTDIQYLAPDHRATFSANWQMGDFTLNLRESYFGEWRDASDYPLRAGNNAANPINDGQHFGGKFITDLDISYTFMDHYTLTVGANNLFNTYPDKIMATVDNPVYTTGGLLNGSVYPRTGGPFGINGGFWYARLRVKY
jgi:iron complex outermembrane receptor protein